ncbi:MAG: 50S ribosomal protein L31e [Candidatus Woesearchaeota archaeon]
MAKKEQAKQVLERTYNIPLRKEYLKAPKYRRAKKAINAAREFLIRHMKSKNIKLGDELNKKIWSCGIKNPPHHIKVAAIKYDDGTVKAELVGFPIEKPKEKQPEKKIAEPKQEAITPAKTESGPTEAAPPGEIEVKTAEPKTAGPSKDAATKPTGAKPGRRTAKPSAKNAGA